MKLTFFILWILAVSALSWGGMPKTRDGGLTPKQARFVELYLIYLNATRAYLESYKPHKKENARFYASQILSNPHVGEAIAKARAERAKLAQVDAEDVVRELKILAFARPDSVFEVKEGVVRVRDFEDIRETDPDALLAIQEVSETTSKDGGSLRAKMYDKTAALRLLGQHLGMFGETGPKGGEDDPDGEGAGASKRTRESVTSGLSGSIGRLRLARGT